MAIKKRIPNTITLGNLFCGCLAIIQIFNGNLVMAAYLVGIALVLDFFDGFSARLLNVASPIGKDLDSLADMVTFGVVPGLMMFHLINKALAVALASNAASAEAYTFGAPYSAAVTPLAYAGLIIPVFSCIRLANFNNDTRQSHSFIGLPTPSCAMVICSLPLIMQFNNSLYPAFLLNPYVLCIVCVLMSILLVAEIPLFALKFKNFSWADNQLRFVFLGLCVLLLALLQFAAIPVIILLYILLSILNNSFFKPKEIT